MYYMYACLGVVFLTFIILVAHDLASSIVKTNRKAWAVRFHVAPSPRVPVDTCYTDSSSRICETADGHFHLNNNTNWGRTIFKNNVAIAI